jgi:hypothetical protein
MDLKPPLSEGLWIVIAVQANGTSWFGVHLDPVIWKRAGRKTDVSVPLVWLVWLVKLLAEPQILAIANRG